jgi:hypothetical protein
LKIILNWSINLLIQMSSPRNQFGAYAAIAIQLQSWRVRQLLSQFVPHPAIGYKMSYFGIPGGRSYYETRSTGPLFAAHPGANGDANVFPPLADLLARRLLRFQLMRIGQRPVEHTTRVPATIMANDCTGAIAEDSGGLVRKMLD